MVAFSGGGFTIQFREPDPAVLTATPLIEKKAKDSEDEPLSRRITGFQETFGHPSLGSFYTFDGKVD